MHTSKQLELTFSPRNDRHLIWSIQPRMWEKGRTLYNGSNAEIMHLWGGSKAIEHLLSMHASWNSLFALPTLICHPRVTCKGLWITPCSLCVRYRVTVDASRFCGCERRLLGHAWLPRCRRLFLLINSDNPGVPSPFLLEGRFGLPPSTANWCFLLLVLTGLENYQHRPVWHGLREHGFTSQAFYNKRLLSQSG